MPSKPKRWKDVRARLDARLTPAQVAEDEQWVERASLELDLREVRELLGITQEELAQRVKTTQSELSRLERREDKRLSTLRRYVEALGGELEVTIRFGNKMVRLSGR
ncbi:MAG: XRE family transcriptional regulator [Deltaproteobacteria bacterium]|nr:XRE family transcriptional regulator [Deltaproteobacteria bacterium]